MTKIQGYLWRSEDPWQKNNLNICINPAQRPLLSALLLPPNQPSQINLTFRTLPPGNPRHFDDPSPSKPVAQPVPIRNLLLLITDRADGFLRCHIQPNQAQWVISTYLIQTFMDHIQECQENAYIGEITMPLFQGNTEGQLVFWSWHQKAAIFL